MQKFLEIFQESNGQLSSTRLFMFFVAISAIVDWQHAIWCSQSGVWSPEYQTIGLVLGVLGFKVLQKNYEEKPLL